MGQPVKPTLNPDWVPGETPPSANLVDPGAKRTAGWQGNDFPPAEHHNHQFHTWGKHIRFIEARVETNYQEVTQKNQTDSPYTLLETDKNLIFDAGAASQVDLPPLATAFDASTGLGMRVTIKNINTFDLTVKGDGAELIDKINAHVLQENDSIDILATPGAWRILG